MLLVVNQVMKDVFVAPHAERIVGHVHVCPERLRSACSCHSAQTDTLHIIKSICTEELQWLENG